MRLIGWSRLWSGLQLAAASTFAAMLTAMMSATPAAAQPAPAGPGILGTDWQLSAGAGAIFSPDYEGSDDYEWTIVPLARATWRNTILLGRVRGGLGAEITPFRFDTLSFTFGAGYWDGRDASDNAALAGLGDIDATIVGTATVANRMGFINAEATLLRDLSGGRDGTAVKLGLSAPVPIPGSGVTLFADASTTWVDDNYMDTTFGVNGVQAARSGYGVYDPGAGFKDVSLGLGASYGVTDNISMTVRASVSQLLGDAADSPIVSQQGSATQATVLGGVTYRF